MYVSAISPSLRSVVPPQRFPVFHGRVAASRRSHQRSHCHGPCRASGLLIERSESIGRRPQSCSTPAASMAPFQPLRLEGGLRIGGHGGAGSPGPPNGGPAHRHQPVREPEGFGPSGQGRVEDCRPFRETGGASAPPPPPPPLRKPSRLTVAGLSCVRAPAKVGAAGVSAQARSGCPRTGPAGPEPVGFEPSGLTGSG
jgi:hypothetical protein